MTTRRGTCPGLADPLPTGDGLLARFAIAHAVPLDTFVALCVAAQTHGNGVMEITSRGSVQVRGLTPISAPVFARTVEGLDITDAAHGRVLGSPLAGLDPNEIFDVTGVADRLRHLLVESGLVAKLATKVSVVFDGGGILHLEDIPCDIRLRAHAASAAVRFRVEIACDGASAVTCGTIAPEHAVDTALALLTAIAAKGPQSRARDLPRSKRFACDPLSNSKSGRSPAQPIGVHALRDGRVALGFGFPFGHCDSDALQRLVKAAQRAGVASARPAPSRVLLLIGVPPAQASGLVKEAERLGFIAKPDDPRRRVVACAGAPACAAAEIPTRSLAPAIAAAARLERQATIHVSGCAKGCAHRAPADLTIVGVAGKCGIVPNGRAQDEPVAFVTPEDLPEYIAQSAAMREMAHG